MSKEIARQPYPDILWEDLEEISNKVYACWRKVKIILAVEDLKAYRYTEEDVNLFKDTINFLVDLVSKKFDPYLEEVELSEQSANDRKWKLYVRRRILNMIHVIDNFDIVSLPLLEKELEESMLYARSLARANVQ